MAIEDRRLNNMHKVLFLIKRFQNKDTVEEVVKMLAWPAIDINVAMWTAIDAGFLEDPAETQKVKVIEYPTNWEFGSMVNDLMADLIYAMQFAARKERDFEEGSLSSWMAGYNATDILVAIHWLLETGKLASYTLEDAQGDQASTYMFYTLPENKKKLWGRKQFKKDPLGENADTPEQ